MVGIIIGSLALLLTFYLYYTLVLKPTKLLKYYHKILEQNGYKVKVYPFVLLGSSVINQLKQNEQKYGDQFYTVKREKIKYDVGLFNVFNKVVLEFYSPELIQEFLSPKHPQLYYKIETIAANIKRSLGDGIAFSQNSIWKRKRKIMNAVFNYNFIQSNIPKIIRICNENFERAELQYKIKNNNEKKDSVGLNILELYSCIFSNVMMQCFFGIASTYEKVQGELIAVFLNKLNADISEQNFKPLTLILGVKYLEMGLTEFDKDINRRLKILKGLANEYIQKRLNELKNSAAPKESSNQNYSDIIEALYNTGKLKTEQCISDQSNYNHKQLIDEFCTFYTAGTDTTSHFTQMMIYYLFRYPDIEKKLREEIDKYFKSDEDITPENLKKITYIDWIQNQTTRMYGPGNGIFIRYATEDHYILNIPIKKNLGVSFQPVINHYSQKYYEQPLKFKPERWENGMTQNHPYSFCGFSGGPRTCIGKHLALLQSKIGLIKFMMRYKSFSLPKKDFRMTLKFLSQPEPMELTAVFA